MDLKSPYKRYFVEHHTKYIETHGVDETIIISTAEHSKIDHRALFPMVTKEELAKISTKAHSRMLKAKNSHIGCRL